MENPNQLLVFRVLQHMFVNPAVIHPIREKYAWLNPSEIRNSKYKDVPFILFSGFLQHGNFDMTDRTIRTTVAEKPNIDRTELIMIAIDIRNPLSPFFMNPVITIPIETLQAAISPIVSGVARPKRQISHCLNFGKDVSPVLISKILTSNNSFFIDIDIECSVYAAVSSALFQLVNDADWDSEFSQAPFCVQSYDSPVFTMKITIPACPSRTSDLLDTIAAQFAMPVKIIPRGIFKDCSSVNTGSGYILFVECPEIDEMIQRVHTQHPDVYLCKQNPYFTIKFASLVKKSKK